LFIADSPLFIADLIADFEFIAGIYRRWARLSLALPLALWVYRLPS